MQKDEPAQTKEHLNPGTNQDRPRNPTPAPEASIATHPDSRRLEAMIKNRWRVGCEEGAAGYPDFYFVFTEDWSRPVGEGHTARAAIDAAIAAPDTASPADAPAE